MREGLVTPTAEHSWLPVADFRGGDKQKERQVKCYSSRTYISNIVQIYITDRKTCHALNNLP
jgi:hypothetical protein